MRRLFMRKYNYAPPIHFAVREGHKDLVAYLLENGANDPEYRFYPFQESLQTVANDRGFPEIERLLPNTEAILPNKNSGAITAGWCTRGHRCRKNLSRPLITMKLTG